MKERTLLTLEWLIAAASSAYACELARVHATPVDRALPLVAFVLASLAFVSYRAVLLSAPLLVIAEVAFVDETMRLLAFGIIVAAALAATRLQTPYAAIAAILILRWIPLEDVHLFRELFLLVLAAAIVFVLGRTPLASAIAVITALITPAFPLRTLALPLAVLVIAILARAFDMPRLRLTAPSVIAVAFATLFFAWSGLLARAWPYFLKPYREPAPRVLVNWALPPNASKTFLVPEGARVLIVSGANVPRARRGFVLGTITPAAMPPSTISRTAIPPGAMPPATIPSAPISRGAITPATIPSAPISRDAITPATIPPPPITPGAIPRDAIPVRIGDAADWGYLRRDHYYGTHNPLPRDPAGKIRGYGYTAWLDGAGRVPLPPRTRAITITAAPDLPRDASLQVEAFELAPR